MVENPYLEQRVIISGLCDIVRPGGLPLQPPKKAAAVPLHLATGFLLDRIDGWWSFVLFFGHLVSISRDLVLSFRRPTCCTLKSSEPIEGYHLKPTTGWHGDEVCRKVADERVASSAHVSGSAT